MIVSKGKVMKKKGNNNNYCLRINNYAKKRDEIELNFVILSVIYATIQMKRALTAIIATMTWASTAFAQSDGGKAFDFLRLPTASHSAALGGNNITIDDDDAAVALANPALLNNVSDNTVSLGYMNYMEGVSDFTAGYVRTINENASVSALAQYINYGTMKQTDMENHDLGNFNASDLALGAQFAYYMGKGFTGGVTARFLVSKLGAYTSTGVGVDLGVNYYNPESELSVSAVARNLGGQITAYVDDFESLPTDLQIGFTKHFTNTPLRLSVMADDVTHWDYSFFRHLTVGADVILSKQIYAAVGYNFRRAHDMKIAATGADEEAKPSAHGAGLTLGVGLQMERFKLHVSYGKYHVSSSSIALNIGFIL